MLSVFLGDRAGGDPSCSWSMIQPHTLIQAPHGKREAPPVVPSDAVSSLQLGSIISLIEIKLR